MIYFVKMNYGEAGDEWVARAPEFCGWDTTINQLTAGEFGGDHVVQVLEVDPVVGTVADVTMKAVFASTILQKKLETRE